jgi:hypothetical protein
MDTNGTVWFCYEEGTPGKWRRVVGPQTAGAFHPVTPARVYDSRVALPLPGKLSMGGNRTISVADARNLTTGAVTVADFVPAGASAVAANVTIVSTTGKGHLAINPGGVLNINASIINWSESGQVLANGVPLTVNASRELTVVLGGTGSTHFIVDILGYWR